MGSIVGVFIVEGEDKTLWEQKLEGVQYVTAGSFIVRPVPVDCVVVDTPTGPKALGRFQINPVSILPRVGPDELNWAPTQTWRPRNV